MSLDGRIATSTGDSQWITSEEARAVAHQLRGRMDAIVVGIGTALADNPRLTVRPPGPRTPTRIVMDSRARLPLSSQLVQTAAEAPVLVYCTTQVPHASVAALEQAGVEVLQAEPAPVGRPSWGALLDELGRRRMTNVLVEGGSEVLGSCFDDGCVDAVHVFLGNKILGGRGSLSPVGGKGCSRIAEALSLESAEFLKMGMDVYLHGRLA
jgi:diaminohydroxyphosphoribosylaminopyrimidine deaminase/5-amino-6-(5-phosphoribosylamino)uracil reductase